MKEWRTDVCRIEAPLGRNSGCERMTSRWFLTLVGNQYVAQKLAYESVKKINGAVQAAVSSVSIDEFFKLYLIHIRATANL